LPQYLEFQEPTGHTPLIAACKSGDFACVDMVTPPALPPPTLSNCNRRGGKHTPQAPMSDPKTQITITITNLNRFSMAEVTSQLHSKPRAHPPPPIFTLPYHLILTKSPSSPLPSASTFLPHSFLQIIHTFEALKAVEFTACHSCGTHSKPHGPRCTTTCTPQPCRGLSAGV
jgi:hypothetical protein